MSYSVQDAVDYLNNPSCAHFARDEPIIRAPTRRENLRLAGGNAKLAVGNLALAAGVGRKRNAKKVAEADQELRKQSRRGRKRRLARKALGVGRDALATLGGASVLLTGYGIYKGRKGAPPTATTPMKSAAP